MTDISYIKVMTGVNGGSSKKVIPIGKFSSFDIGKDNNIRIEFTNGSKTYPVMELIEAPDWIFDMYDAALHD